MRRQDPGPIYTTTQSKPGPVIDVHTHLFNASHLPLENIVRGRVGEVLNPLDEPVIYGAVKLLNAARGLAQVIPYLARYSGRSIKKASLSRRVGMLTAATQGFVSAEHLAQMRGDSGKLVEKLDEREKDLLIDPDTGDLMTQAKLDSLCREEWKNLHPGREPKESQIADARIKRLRKHLEAMVYFGALICQHEDADAFTGDHIYHFTRRLYKLFMGQQATDHLVALVYARDVGNLARIIEDVVDGHGGHGVLACSNTASGSNVRDHWSTLRVPGLRLPRLVPSPDLTGVHQESMATSEEWFWFAAHLTRSIDQCAKAFQRDYPEIDLAVYQMMNMGPSYDQAPQTGHYIPGAPSATMYDFQKQQTAIAEQIQEQSDGHVIHFVAYNPFESIGDPKCPSEPLGSLPSRVEDYPVALRNVHEALKRGAWGVKFYPPMGYRPTGNAGTPCDDKLDDPNPFVRSGTLKWTAYFNTDKVKQWKARYDQPDWNGKKLDALNDMLFRYCVKHDVPLFTHCNTGEMRVESMSQRFAHPRFWEMVLERHPRLRLCLGHAGNYGFWCELPAGWDTEGKDKPGTTRCYPDWGLRVARLCAKYPNVYCELGIHEQLADPGLASRFVVVVDDLCNFSTSSGRSAQVYPASGPRYNLSKKMMYGSDWFMPVGESPAAYLEGFLRTYNWPALRPVAKDFFAGNAVRFLRVREQVSTNPLIKTNPKAVTRLKALADQF